MISTNTSSSTADFQTSEISFQCRTAPTISLSKKPTMSSMTIHIRPGATGFTQQWASNSFGSGKTYTILEDLIY